MRIELLSIVYIIIMNAPTKQTLSVIRIGVDWRNRRNTRHTTYNNNNNKPCQRNTTSHCDLVHYTFTIKIFNGSSCYYFFSLASLMSFRFVWNPCGVFFRSMTMFTTTHCLWLMNWLIDYVLKCHIYYYNISFNDCYCCCQGVLFIRVILHVVVPKHSMPH